MIRSTFFSLLTLALAAQNPATTPTTEAQKKEAPKPAPAKKADKVVAIIGKERVMQSDVDAVIAALPDQQRMQVEMTPNGREQYTQMYLNSILLSAKARLDGIDKTDGYKKKVAQAEEQLLASELLNRDGEALRAKMQVSDDDVKAYFEKNKEKFKTPDKYSARHILVSIKPANGTDKGVTEEDAKAKVAKIQEELAKGGKFEDLAKEYTDDPGSKDKGGIYEDFDPAQMVPEFAQAVRTQEIDKVGPPVKTRYGFHLIQVTKKNVGAVPTFDSAKDQVRQTMTPELQEKVFKAYLEQIQLQIPMITGDAAEKAAKMIPAKSAGSPKAVKTAKVGSKKPTQGATK
jgi:peptidyl-prolyl cis-trans isomerase C